MASTRTLFVTQPCIEAAWRQCRQSNNQYFRTVQHAPFSLFTFLFSTKRLDSRQQYSKSSSGLHVLSRQISMRADAVNRLTMWDKKAR